MTRQVARSCHLSSTRQHGNSGQHRTSVTTHASQSGIANRAIASVPTIKTVMLSLSEDDVTQMSDSQATTDGAQGSDSN